MFADEKSVVFADKKSVMFSHKKFVVSADKKSVVYQDIPMVWSGKFGPGRDIPDLRFFVGVGQIRAGPGYSRPPGGRDFWVRPDRPARPGRALKNGSKKRREIVMEICHGGF